MVRNIKNQYIKPKNKSWDFIKKRFVSLGVGPVEIVFTIIFTLFLVIGYILSNYPTIDIVPIGNKLKLAYTSATLIISLIILFILLVIKDRLKHKSTKSSKFIFSSISNIKLWYITSFAILFFHLPIILLSFSVLTPDSWSSIRQSMGIDPLSNHHPVIFTAFVSIFIKTGLLLNNIDIGIVLFTITQSIILAMIFATVIVWMRNEKIGKAGLVSAFIFYSIFPINVVAGIIMWKDILFAGFGLLLLMLVRKLYIDKASFFNKNNIILFIIVAFLFSIWRNNGVYVYTLFAIVAIITNYKVFMNKKYIMLFIAPIIIFMAYSTVISLIAKPGKLSETLSVPLQQIARTVKYNSQFITMEQQNTINEVLPFNEIGDRYNPVLSDPIKDHLNNELFKQNPTKYAKLWLNLFMSNKKTYFAAFLYNTYGYVYPYYYHPWTVTDVLRNSAMQKYALENYNDITYSNGNKKAVEEYTNIFASAFPLMRNIGFYTFLILLSAYVAIIRNRKELMGVYILLLFVFLTTILGPVNGEFRYLYIFVISLPFVIVSVLSTRLIKKTKKS